MLWIALFVLGQSLDLPNATSWADLAKPWMTSEEAALYERLSPAERQIFQGTFIARRVEDPRQWLETGKYLPAFHCPKPHGDIRDQILFLLGEPSTVASQPSNPALPARWTFSDRVFTFELRPDGHVALDPQGEAVWDQAKRAAIRHPEIRYDFQVRSFGRTRLPEDVLFAPVEVANQYQVPKDEGALLNVQIPIPESFRQILRETKANPIQHMELLVRLNRTGEVVAQAETQTRHASQRLDLLRETYFHFEVFLPSGYYDAELQIYSGYLKSGLSARLPIAIRTAELPRVSDPIICQEWAKAGVERFSTRLIGVGEQFYKASPRYLGELPARVLVKSDFADTRLMLQNGSESRMLKTIEHTGSWWIYELPSQRGPFRLLALGYPETGATVALSSTGSWAPGEAATPVKFEQEGSPNYLALEHMNFAAQAGLGLMFVNDQAYLASRDGSFDWRPFDWGKVARLAFETAGANGWQRSLYTMRRSAVYEQVSVKPKYLVAGTRNREGEVTACDFQFSVVGQPVKITRTTPYRALPKLWGIIVNDPLLRSTSWPMVRDALKRWLRQNTQAGDLIYVVHNSDRPQLVLSPSDQKVVVQAALDSLAPRSEVDHYFTVQYLIDALTHMSEHQTRAHQVLLMTDGLTDDVRQMEDLLPTLRATGLQLYNLEFPVSIQEEPEKSLTEGKDALETMAIRDENYRSLRGNLSPEREGVPVASIQFGGRKRARQLKEARLRDQALHDAFNRQIAGLTAGLTASAEIGQSAAGLERFFDQLTAWENNLVHLELSVPYLDADLVKPIVPDGCTVSWTVVTWRVP